MGGIPNFSRYDGTGRQPRQVQRDVFTWLTSIWNESPVKAITAPPATGKSFIARTIQRATGGVIITPSNLLIDQYSDTYPTVNTVKGKIHYKCAASGMTCHEWCNVLDQKACPGCPYVTSKAAARQGDPTIFNPMSLAYFVKAQATRFPCIVIDEAHALPGMLLHLVSRRLRKSNYFFTDAVTNELELHRWLLDQNHRLYKLAGQWLAKNNQKEAARCREDADSFALLAETVSREPYNIAVWIEDEHIGRGKKEQYLNIRPVVPPKFLVDAVCNTDHLILMSGTLFPHDVSSLSGGDRVEWFDVLSPIPVDSRSILYRPTPFKLNATTDPGDIVTAIEAILEEFSNRNTIIHVSYSLSKKLAPLFKCPILYNTVENKDAILQRFKTEGGVFLAAGCAEGIDLRDDLCRLNIIPKLLFPDLTDPAVRKRQGFKDGETWYDLETLKTTIQQAGRSSRHEKDHSTTVVMDPNFSRLVLRHRKLLPKSFVESIKWRGK